MSAPRLCNRGTASRVWRRRKESHAARLVAGTLPALCRLPSSPGGWRAERAGVAGGGGGGGGVAESPGRLATAAAAEGRPAVTIHTAHTGDRAGGGAFATAADGWAQRPLLADDGGGGVVAGRRPWLPPPPPISWPGLAADPSWPRARGNLPWFTPFPLPLGQYAAPATALSLNLRRRLGVG